MLYTIRDQNDRWLHRIQEDPVRPHIPAHERIGPNRDIFLSLDGQRVQAITCVSYHSDIPSDERDLFCQDPPRVAVFYTIWSYASGAARALLFDAVDHIRRTQAEIQRFVTLSPKTDMAHRFHIGNGAGILRENASTINYEYHLD